MRAVIRFFIFLALIFLALSGAGYVAVRLWEPGIEFREITVLLSGGLIITAVVFIIFISGLRKEKGKPVLYTLAAIGIKFLLYLALIGVYAIFSDELAMPFLTVFFVMYLAYTSFLLITFVRLLKSQKQTVPDGKEK